MPPFPQKQQEIISDSICHVSCQKMRVKFKFQVLCSFQGPVSIYCIDTFEYMRASLGWLLKVT